MPELSSRAGPVTGRPTVLFIAGPSRSGSTMLDLLLGELDGYVATGELRNLWGYGLLDGWLCGCREPMLSCPFWRAVLERAGLDGVDPAWVDETQRLHVRLRPGPLARILLFRRFGVGLSPRLASYAKLMAELYRGVLSVSGARVVVDSSKRPVNVLLLAACADVDLFVVHLVRDPRGVANSWLRERDNPANPTGKRTQVFHPLVTGARWAAWNGAIQALVKRWVGDRFMLLRYEEFASDPVSALNRITTMVEGRARSPAAFLDGSRARLGPNHTAVGNRNRFVSGEITIRCDEAWRERMGTKDKILATLPSLPLLTAYGYPVLPPTAGHRVRSGDGGGGAGAHSGRHG
jgi:Sulfotransferase family